MWLAAAVTLWARSGASVAGTPGPAEPVGVQVTDEWLLGINEAISAPPGLEGSAATIVLEGDAALLATLDARYARMNASASPRLFRVLRDPIPDWTEVDAAFRRFAAIDVSVVVVVAPWPANEPWTLVSSCAIEDVAAWQARVEALVERYDGDGVEDAGGTARVLAWEVDNEPDLHDDLRPGFCPPAMHAETVRVTAQAIRRADAGATVLNGGLYRPHAATGRAWLQAAVDAGLRDHIDGFSGHLYPSPGNEAAAVEKLVRNAHEVLGDLPIWITETSTRGLGDGTGARAEAEQARGVAALLGAARHAGVHAVFWHTLADPPVMKPGGVPYPGLFAVDDAQSDTRVPTARAWRPKPAVDVFQKMQGSSQISGADGDLAWIEAEGGWLIWSTSDQPGCGRPPARPAPFAGGTVKDDPCGWQVRGVAWAQK